MERLNLALGEVHTTMHQLLEDGAEVNIRFITCGLKGVIEHFCGEARRKKHLYPHIRDIAEFAVLCSSQIRELHPPEVADVLARFIRATRSNPPQSPTRWEKIILSLRPLTRETLPVWRQHFIYPWAREAFTSNIHEPDKARIVLACENGQRYGEALAQAFESAKRLSTAADTVMPGKHCKTR